MNPTAQLESSARQWMNERVKPAESARFMDNGMDFISEYQINHLLEENRSPSKQQITDIIQKSLAIERLEPNETAALLNVSDPQLWSQIFEAAGKIKKAVYDNRIVTFAPLYCGSFCVNNCLYCGFRSDNPTEKRRILSIDDLRKEAQVLAGDIGHKRVIAVFGEHPLTDINYISDALDAIYDVRVTTRTGYGNIRRVNVNAAPFSIEELKLLKRAGIGTYQVFQETYHHATYSRVHPKGTIKSDYEWRLYALHRAQAAGIDDVAIGVLFGLYDWRFEVMGLLQHAIDLERHFGIGPHTVSFPRLEPAAGTLMQDTAFKVSDDDFRKLIAVIRLSIPYSGMILTARESAGIRRDVLPLGITQTDASTKIGIGAYSDRYNEQEAERQQFLLGDTRSLDEVILELVQMGYITSFCTAGYRCSRTGKCIMELLKSGKERWFCKANAVLTFQEWLNDFASPATKASGEILIRKEIDEIKAQVPNIYPQFSAMFERINRGERDLYF